MKDMTVGNKGENMSVKKHFATAHKKEMLDEEMSIIGYASTNEVDRHGEMILSSAWTEKGLSDYRKNPVCLVNHNYSEVAHAKSIWQKSDENGLKFKVKFAPTETGKELYSLYAGGFMNSFSVGFSPIRSFDNSVEQKYMGKDGSIPHTVYEECSLLEVSMVSIPANASANTIRGYKSLVKSFDEGEYKSEEVKKIVDQIKELPEFNLDSIELEDSVEKEIDEEIVEEKQIEVEDSVEKEMDEEVVEEKEVDTEEVVEKEMDEEVVEKEIEEETVDTSIFFDEDGRFVEMKDFPKGYFHLIDDINFDEDGLIKSILLIDNIELFEEFDENAALKEELKDLISEVESLRKEIFEIKSTNFEKEIEFEIEEKEIAKDELVEIDVEQLASLVAEAVSEMKREKEIDLSQIAIDAVKKAKGEMF